MAQFFTDFTEYSTGAQPSDWTERWHTGDAAATVESSGIPSGGGDQALKIIVSTGSRYALSWDEVGFPVGDVEILVRYYLPTIPPSVNGPRALVCGAGDDSSESAYFMTWGDDSGAITQLAEYNNAASTAHTQTAQAGAAAGEWWWVRLQRNGNVIRSRNWEDGDNEPGSWDESVSDSSLTGGWVGVSGFDADTYWVDQIGVGTGVSSAPSSAVLAGTPIDGGGLPLVTFTNTASIGVALPASREWVLPSAGEAGVAQLVVPWDSPAASESYIDPEGGSFIRIEDAFGTGVWRGYITNVSYSQAGITVDATQEWAILARYPVSFHQTIKYATPAAIVAEAIEASPLNAGAMVEGPPVVEEWEFHGESIWDVISQMMDLYGYELHAHDDGTVCFGTVGSLVSGLFMAGGDAQNVGYGLDVGPQWSQVTALSGENSITAGETITTSPWAGHMVEKVNNATIDELYEAADSILDDNKFPDEVITMAVRSEHWTIAEGDWVQVHIPWAQFGGVTRIARVIRRSIDQTNEVMQLGLLVERPVEPGETGTASVTFNRRRRQRRESALKRLRRLDADRFRGHRYESDALIADLRSRVAALE